MKKELVTMAVLTYVGAACHAQSSVTLYGAVNTYVGRIQASGNGSRNVLNSGFNPSILGFTGTEDLGGGLRAGFVLEGQPSLDTGAFGQGGKVFGRQSLVYLSGNWGRVSLGRLHTAGRAFGVKYSATGWLTSDPIGNLEIAMGAGISPAMTADGVGQRYNNAISYNSPKLGDFTFSVLQSFNEDGRLSAGQAKVSILGLNWASGPVSLDAVVSHFPAVAGSQIKQLDYALGGTYDAGFAKLFAAFQAKRGYATVSADSVVAIADSEATDRMFVIGAQVPVGAGMIGGAIGKTNVSRAHRGHFAANVSTPFATALDNATAWSLAYSHYLSKRTSLFMAYGSLGNAGSGTASLFPDMRPAAGGSSRILALGVHHVY